MLFHATMITTGDGTTKSFVIPFPYLHTSHVKVYVNGSPVGFTFGNTSTVTLNVTPPIGSTIRIQRETPRTVPAVVYSAGSLVQASDLNYLALQELYSIQEVEDGYNLAYLTLTDDITALANRVTYLESSVAGIRASMWSPIILTGVYNGIIGTWCPLPTAVASVNDYDVLVTSGSRFGQIGDVWVVKATTGFTVYCSEDNYSDIFWATVTFTKGSAQVVVTPSIHGLTAPGVDRYTIIQTLGFYQAGDLGEGLYRYNPTKPRGDHNGITVINPAHISVPGTSDWYLAGNMPDGYGCWELVGEPSIETCGAVDSNGFLVNAALTAALKYSAASGTMVVTRSNTIELQAAYSIEENNIRWDFSGTTLSPANGFTTTNYLLTIEGDNIEIVCGTIDWKNRECNGILFNGEQVGSPITPNHTGLKLRGTLKLIGNKLPYDGRGLAIYGYADLDLDTVEAKGSTFNDALYGNIIRIANSTGKIRRLYCYDTERAINLIRFSGTVLEAISDEARGMGLYLGQSSRSPVIWNARVRYAPMFSRGSDNGVKISRDVLGARIHNLDIEIPELVASSFNGLLLQGCSDCSILSGRVYVSATEADAAAWTAMATIRIEAHPTEVEPCNRNFIRLQHGFELIGSTYPLPTCYGVTVSNRLTDTTQCDGNILELTGLEPTNKRMVSPIYINSDAEVGGEVVNTVIRNTIAVARRNTSSGNGLRDAIRSASPGTQILNSQAYSERIAISAGNGGLVANCMARNNPDSELGVIITTAGYNNIYYGYTPNFTNGANNNSDSRCLEGWQ